jgi:6-phosphogluconolactonase (cycloisomerase 2 family)
MTPWRWPFRFRRFELFRRSARVRAVGPVGRTFHPRLERLEERLAPALTAIGAGPGGQPLVTILNSSGAVVASFEAYNPAFTGGVSVAMADLNGDGVPDIITGAGPGGGPQVNVFDGTTFQPLDSFFAYNPSFGGGVNVAAGDLGGTGQNDIITGAGSGGGPQVNVFDGSTLALIRSFFAYSPAFAGGVSVAAGDVNGDGADDIVTAPGAGGGPQVNVFDGPTGNLLSSFFAYNPAFAGGVNVATGAFDSTGKVQLVTGPGPIGGPDVRVWNPLPNPTLAGEFLALGGTDTGGVHVGALLGVVGSLDTIAATSQSSAGTLDEYNISGALLNTITVASGGIQGFSIAARPAAPSSPTVYIETNNNNAGQNAVLAFREDLANGGLQEFGSFATGGTGQINLPPVMGPDDASQEVTASPDGRWLFAVNQGSDTIASFAVERDGSLERVDTFSSGGVQPDSIGISGNFLYVSNRGDSARGQPGTVAPSITGFSIGADGSLTPLPNAVVTFPVDTSPAQNLISRDGRFLFADIFAVAGSTAAQGNTFAPFQISAAGALTLAPGGNVGAPVTPPALLGSDTNPNMPIVYAGLPGAAQVGVFTFDNNGSLTFVTAVAAQGKATCWIAVSADGKYLYASDNATNSIAVFSLANPLQPVEIQEFTLGGPQAPSGSPPGTVQTGPFQLAFSPDGHTLYVVSQNQSPTGDFAQGNQLHILAVAANGTLTEPTGPILLSDYGVPGTAHPQGVAVVDG